LEGVGILHENLHELHIKEQNWAIFKIDFAKMYDKIKMEFCLQQAPRIEGFDLVWCEWVKAFVQGGNTSIKGKRAVGPILTYQKRA